MQGVFERVNQGIEWNVKTDATIVIGLTSLFSSLLIYSAVMMGFRRFQYVTDIMGVFAPILLIGALVTGVVLFVLTLRRRLLSTKVLCGFGGLLSIVGAAIFCMFITGYRAPEAIVAVCALSAGAGEVMVCCVWGRIGTLLSFEKALVLIVGAFALALGIELLISSSAEMFALGLYIGCTIVAAAVPLFIPLTGQSVDEGDTDEMPMGKRPKHILKVLQELALEPAIGVLVFAFCLGSMRALFWEAHNEYIVGSLGAAIIAVLVLVLPRKQSLTRLFSVIIIPSCAVALLAINNIVLRVGQGNFLAQSLLYLFFGLAVILTLATLCATAHGGEISGDVLFSGMLALFAGASLAGQATAEFCSDSVIEAMVGVIIALYALAVVIMRSISIDKAWGTFAGFEQPRTTEETQLPMLHDSSQVCNEAQCTEPSPEDYAEGDSALSRQEACDIIAKQYGLTSREEEILALLARGHNGVYISEILFISPNTVRTHIHNIYRKLGVSSREEVLSMTNPEYQREM